jgi:hypothetical protein
LGFRLSPLPAPRHGRPRLCQGSWQAVGTSRQGGGRARDRANHGPAGGIAIRVRGLMAMCIAISTVGSVWSATTTATSGTGVHVPVAREGGNLHQG